MTASVDQQGGLYKLTNPEKQNLVLTHSLLAVNVARNWDLTKFSTKYLFAKKNVFFLQKYNTINWIFKIKICFFLF